MAMKLVEPIRIIYVMVYVKLANLPIIFRCEYFTCAFFKFKSHYMLK